MAALNFKLLFALVYLQCFSQAVPRSIRDVSTVYLNITSSLDTFTPVLTTELTITCSVPHPDTVGYNKLVTLFISKKDPDTPILHDIASVSAFEPEVINYLGNTSAMVSGQINSTGSSFLRLHWSYPAQDAAGFYQCEATVFDMSGHPLTIKAGREVNGMEPALQDFTESIRSMKSELDELRRMAIEFNQFKDRLTQATMSLFKATEVHNGSRYFFSQHTSEIKAAEAECTLVDGHLVEIDDQAEYDFIVQALNSSQYYLADEKPDYIYIGITDRYSEGKWEYWHSRKPVTFFNWSGPVRLDKDCAILSTNFSYKYFEVDCVEKFYYFMCERKEK